MNWTWEIKNGRLCIMLDGRLYCTDNPDNEESKLARYAAVYSLHAELQALVGTEVSV